MGIYKFVLLTMINSIVVAVWNLPLNISTFVTLIFLDVLILLVFETIFGGDK